MRALITLLLPALAFPASAANFVVDDWSADRRDLVPGDGLCQWSTAVPVGQRCTLRAAIMEANALPGSHTISIPGGATIVLDLAGRGEDAAVSGDLDITKSLVIASSSAGDHRPLIDGNGIDRVFDIHSGAVDVVFSRLRITGGLADSPGTSNGGGIRSGASGQLVVFGSEIRGNVANAGGGLWILGDARIDRSSIRENIAGNFGITNTQGAAIFADLPGSVLHVHDSSVTANLAMSGFLSTRAAIEAHGVAELRIENSTVADNLPNGIYVHNADAMVLNHLTLVGASAGGTALHAFRFSDILSSTIGNSIIAGYGTACQFTGAGTFRYTHDYTLADDASCPLAGFGTGNLVDTDPMLRPMRLDEPTQTWVYLPAAGSPVIDAGDPLVDPAGSCLPMDQIGTFRPLPGEGGPSGRCDIGAIEYIDRLFAHGFEPLPGLQP